MHLVEVRCGGGCDKELGPVCVFPPVGHRQQEWTVMVDFEGLVFERSAVDGVTACAVEIDKVAT